MFKLPSTIEKVFFHGKRTKFGTYEVAGKYHIVFISKYRRKAIYGQYREEIGQIIRQLCNYKGIEILEGHMMPDHVHMLVTNFFPHIDSEDHALLRRCICIPFQRTFKEKPDPENPAEGLIDYGLEEKLKAEYPQILCWLVQGAIRFLQEGLNIPDYIEAAAEEYRKDKDILGTFLNEFCTTEDFPAFRSNQKQEPAEILSTELYGAFAQWCLESNLRPYSAISNNACWLRDSTI